MVRQSFPDRSIADIPGEVRRQMEQADFASRVKPGARIAIGAGSRGIANLAIILRAMAGYWKAHGCQPFVFPAMGSHGAATAEGQAAVLANYGVVESALGCPVVSSLEVVSTGRTPEGIETFMDRQAFESDGVMLTARVKWHTSFTGKIESGLCKMSAIGIGKFTGAQTYHAFSLKLGMEQVVRSVYRQVAKSGKILGGLAILEDANHATAHLAAVHAEELEQREEELLELTKSWMGRIPIDPLDLLIVDEMGKDISGTGMDTKVVNRSIDGVYNCYPDVPVIDRIFVRDLTDLTHGNAVGIGMPDIVSTRLVERVDWEATYVNSLTSCTPAGARRPVHYKSDRVCLEKIAPTVGKFDLGQLRIGWIADTLSLGTLGLSENLLPEIRKNPMLQVVSEPFDLEFDSEGDLLGLEQLAGRLSPVKT
jgi:hypothetical protein